MPALLASYLTRFLPWLIGGLCVIGCLIYVWYLRDQLRTAQGDIASAQSTIVQLSAINQQNLVALKVLRAEDAAWQATLATTLASDSQITRFTDGLLQTIATAPAKNDAAVAPVLADTLASIAQTQGVPR
ncbi:hypothetical protein AruPA_15915 [Acidiphilium sp. PA]|uniref:hypothetical protein n=1 Tax=Acidiphilium sp. PA TaxID=2871705 RepID=UPI0022447230|nr:hypothetical protein [Acidiphilium sp. PA]MCW8308524.1 hypothetical protein [Acidiphilium sp. PA]